MAEVAKQLINLAFELLPGVFSAIAILVLTRFAIGLVSSVMNRALGRVEPTLRKFSIQVAETCTLIVGVLTALNAMGIAATSAAAVLGAAGLAIGLAWRDTLSHFASGVMLITVRPFEVGDFIEGAGVAGVVDEIGIFSTAIITPDNVKITVPNGRLFNDTLKNNTALGKRRVDITVDIGDRPVTSAMSDLRELAQSHPLVLQEPPPDCVVISFSRKETVLQLRPWCSSASYEKVRSDLQKTIVEELWQSHDSQT